MTNLDWIKQNWTIEEFAECLIEPVIDGDRYETYVDGYITSDGKILPYDEAVKHEIEYLKQEYVDYK